MSDPGASVADQDTTDIEKEEPGFLDRDWRLPWQRDFLENLTLVPVVAEAARRARVGRQYAYEVRKADEEFAAAWDEAYQQGVGVYEGQAHVWGRAGIPLKTTTTRTKTVDGKVAEEVVTVVESVDVNPSLLMFVTKRHRPEYRDTVKVSHGGDPDAPPIQHEHDVFRIPTHERMLELAQLARELEPGQADVDGVATRAAAEPLDHDAAA